MPFGKEYRLKSILGVHLATIGSSHFCSVIDVILGSLRFVANNFRDPKKEETCRTLVAQLSPLFYRPHGRVSVLSLWWSPKRIKAPKFLEEYEQLHEFLKASGVEAEYEPNGVPA